MWLFDIDFFSTEDLAGIDYGHRDDEHYIDLILVTKFATTKTVEILEM